MARITTLNVPADLKERYQRIMATLERWYFPRISRKPRLLSRRQKERLRHVTYFFYASDLWREKSAAEKQAWKDAAAKNYLNGWQLYLQDKVYRVENNIPGDATPSIYHQSFVGHIKIASPASSILITQRHPYTWWEHYKVAGRKKMYSKKKITERLSFPFKIAISRKTNLTAVGSLPYCYLIAKITHFYQGHLYYTEYPIDMPLVDDWGYQEISIDAPGGYVGTYELQIRLNDVTGNLWFDNIIAEHDGTYYARDWKCDDITREFFDEWFNVARNWEPTNVPEGALYESIYPGVFTKYIEASTDDVFEWVEFGPPENKTNYGETQEIIEIGDADGTSFRGGFRWTKIDIPQGATILAAKVSFHSALVLNPNYPQIEIRGIDEDNTPTFSSGNEPFDRAQTDALVNWTLEGSPETAWRDTPDLKDIIQEIVNRAGWSPDNALALYFKGLQVGSGQNSLDVHTYDWKPNYAAKLMIVYE